MTHQPKGGMCATCEYRYQDCSGLPFSDMKKYRDNIVICDRHKRLAGTGSNPLPPNSVVMK